MFLKPIIHKVKFPVKLIIVWFRVIIRDIRFDKISILLLLFRFKRLFLINFIPFSNWLFSRSFLLLRIRAFSCSLRRLFCNKLRVEISFFLNNIKNSCLSNFIFLIRKFDFFTLVCHTIVTFIRFFLSTHTKHRLNFRRISILIIHVSISFWRLWKLLCFFNYNWTVRNWFYSKVLINKIFHLLYS